MEVLRKTPLSTVREMREELERRQTKIEELSETKELLEGQIIDLMNVSATLYEENVFMQEQSLSTMEALADLYELMSGGNS